MKVDILCTDPLHPVVAYLQRWINDQSPDSYDIALFHSKNDLRGGDLLFLVSCNEIITADVRQKFRHSFVLHASDLPKGRGWSPYIWDLLAGADSITLSLLSASDAVDRGEIWAKRQIPIPKHFLVDEINDALFNAEVAMLTTALNLVEEGDVCPNPQEDKDSSYHRKRVPQDSELDPSMPLVALFDQIRIADPERYPAFFTLHGNTYQIILKKVNNND